MKKFLSVFVFLSHTLFAGTHSFLNLRGTTLQVTKTKIVEFQMSSEKTQVLFSTQNNSKHGEEGQKFEFMDLDPNDASVQIKKLSNNGRGTQYEIIITEKKSQRKETRPLFLKISAN